MKKFDPQTMTRATSADIVRMWRKLYGDKPMPTTDSTYEFSYAMSRLRDAIDYAQTDGDFQQARIWSNRVEAAYNADIAALEAEVVNLNEGAKLLHSLAMNGEISIPADVALLSQWQDEVEATRKSDYPR